MSPMDSRPSRFGMNTRSAAAGISSSTTLDAVAVPTSDDSEITFSSGETGDTNTTSSSGVDISGTSESSDRGESDTEEEDGAETNEYVTLQDVHDAVELYDLPTMERKIRKFSKQLGMPLAEKNSTNIIGGILSRPVLSKSQWKCSIIHVWAQDRFDLDQRWYWHKKKWLKDMSPSDMLEDASESLHMLINCGVDPHVRCSDGYTALHLAMTGGHSCAVRALLTNEQIKYTTDHFKELDKHGDNVLSSALSNGQLECARLFIEHTQSIEGVLNLHDKYGNNVLALLCQYCNVNYHSDEFDVNNPKPACDGDELTSLQLLRDVLGHVREKEMVDVLLHKNIYGENCLHVAARCGNLLEVREILSIDFGCGRAVANRWSEEVGHAPLGCAEMTLAMVDKKSDASEFRAQQIHGLENDNDPERRCTIDLSNWKRNSILPLIQDLKRANKQKSISMESDIVLARPGIKLGTGQRLSEEARRVLNSIPKPKGRKVVGE